MIFSQDPKEQYNIFIIYYLLFMIMIMIINTVQPVFYKFNFTLAAQLLKKYKFENYAL